jgi:hypothetical protein
MDTKISRKGMGGAIGDRLVNGLEKGQESCGALRLRQLVCTEGVRVRSGIAAGEVTMRPYRINIREASEEGWTPIGMAIIDVQSG